VIRTRGAATPTEDPAVVWHAGRNAGVTHGFLIVPRFDEVYARSVARWQFTRDWYAIPRVDREPSSFAIRYRGTDREALEPSDSNPIREAELFRADLERTGRCVDALLFDVADVHAAVPRLGGEVPRYETIWVREQGETRAPPSGFVPLGFGPSHLVGDHLFATAGDAERFTDDCCSFDWTENERADYVMVEVFALPSAPHPWPRPVSFPGARRRRSCSSRPRPGRGRHCGRSRPRSPKRDRGRW
jgi:hypothetical protein